ncbi:hypothetical protein ACLOJK_000215 [Asimina triloba]
MAAPLLLLSFTLFCFLPLIHANANEAPKAYIVYMGSSANSNGERDFDAEHLQMLSSIIPSEESERLSLIHSYDHAFIGFSAMLTGKEAALLSGRGGVVSVFPDPLLHLHTTHSWDFLQLSPPTKHLYSHASDDIIIGLIDTGIWPESPSFDDKGMGEIPSRWKGTCMEGANFTKSNCNRKVIGARYYSPRVGRATQPREPVGSPRDMVGHGTHTASTAGGALVHNASYYGLAKGLARGGFPTSRIAAYQACSLQGCSGATLLKAIDDAVKDGVDIISISIGISAILQSDFLNDPIAIGAFHANQKGVMVVCSGGNDGPDPFTVVNSAPWIFTVAASTIDRSFQSSIVLGNGAGSAINFSNLTRKESYPVVFARDIAAKSVPAFEASNCYPGSLDGDKTAGKIVVCMDTDPTVPRRLKKMTADDAGAKGMILIRSTDTGVPFDSGSFPYSEVGFMDGNQILKYLNSTKKPRATILPTVTLLKSQAAPAVASFSSRGPGVLAENILKPDIMAPGVAILASSVPPTDGIPAGKKASGFSLRSGTSMSCPHVAGAAAFLKSARPNWTSSMIRSALMTTATLGNNVRKPITNSTGGYASPHEMGAGEINPNKALHPGLVYDSSMTDYLNFLCFYGYKDTLISTVSGTSFKCPKPSSEELISNVNYPSISIAKIRSGGPPVMVTRTVTNVGPSNSSYAVQVRCPSGLAVKVSPQRLVFSDNSKQQASFHVTFGVKRATTKGYIFGYLTWSDGVHDVRSFFAVNVL